MNLRQKVEIILVEPAEGGNVGSAARALLNCGFRKFSLVNPQIKDWHMASIMAVHAADLVDEAKRFATLEQAVARSHWIVGVSGRPRSNPERKEPLGPVQLIKRLKRLESGQKASLVFGSERTGLTNVHLGLCQDILCLPTDAAYTSLNLAHAVLLVAWTIHQAQQQNETTNSPQPTRQVVSGGELTSLIEHAQRTLEIIGFLNPQNPRLILDNLRNIFSRANLDLRELNLLRGIFHRMDVWISEHGGPPTPNQMRYLD